MSQLIDPFDRQITYLRLSVTDRCDFRCRYCMAEEMTFLPKRDVLSIEEMERLCQAFVELGVRKIRLTGGEPLVRRGLMTLIERLGDMGLDEVTLTTNASQLSRFAKPLYAAGVRRLNVSLDSLEAAKFSFITRGGDLGQVLSGLEAAKQAGLKIKINTVALKGQNEDELDTFVAWCGAEGFDLTFIEVMPLGDIGGDLGNERRIDQFLPLTEVRARLASRWTLTQSLHRTGGPSRYVDVAETGQRVGFISPLTQNFCDGCNRVRLTCTGQLILCLGHEEGRDLRAILRSSEGTGAVKEAIAQALRLKPKRHDFIIAEGATPAVPRHMSVTGG